MKNKPARSELFLAIYPNSQLENIREAIAISGAEIVIENVAYDINGEFIPDSFTIYRKTVDANIAGFGDAYAHIIGADLPRGPIDTSKLPKTTPGLKEVLSKIHFDEE
ncbi:hypothetical protein K9F62_11095 [Desulfovibrio sp. JY]|nr:hypothetical protein K9F62_11095 [Desulfovibrio sp. JY]